MPTLHAAQYFATQSGVRWEGGGGTTQDVAALDLSLSVFVSLLTTRICIENAVPRLAPGHFSPAPVHSVVNADPAAG